MANDVLDFLTRVVPWGHGLVSLHWKVKDRPGMPGWPFSAPEDLLAKSLYCISRPALYGDLYFCLASQVKTAEKKRSDQVMAWRDGANVHSFKAIWLDVDGYKSEKGYGSLQEALKAIMVFVSAAMLPPPTALVCSGGGWHVYWISDKALTEAEWRPYAEGLWALAQKHGLKADAVTTDSVRVLRIPDTFNYKEKTPRMVKLAALAPTDYDFKSSLSAIKAPEGLITHRKKSPTVGDVCDVSKFTGGAILPADDRGVGLDFRDAPLALEPLLGASGCPHVLDAFQTAGAHYAQPLWHLDGLLATFLKDGRRLFQRMSNGHKSYSSGDTDAMFDRKVNEKEERGLGWPSCAALEGAGCKSCAICPHKGKIRSPLNLTHPATATPFLSRNEIVATAGTLSASSNVFVVNPLKLPKHYSLQNGFICKRVSKLLQGDKSHDEWQPLYGGHITNPYMTINPDYLHFTYQSGKDKPRNIAISYESTYTQHELMHEHTRQGVSVIYGMEAAVMEFEKSWVDGLKTVEESQQNVPFGWVVKEGGEVEGFVYGGFMHHRDGTETAAGKDDRLLDRYRPYGQPKPWFTALNLITSQPRIELEVIVAASFAAPLLRATGKDGAVVSAISTENGANKSTAVDVGNAVWGNPKMIKAVPDSSLKSMMKSMAGINNLPLYWDDVKNKKMLNEACDFADAISSGKEPDKLTSRRDFAVTGFWQTLLIICSNESMVDALLKRTRSNTASISRVFEFDVPLPVDFKHGPGRVTNATAETIEQDLQYNFGLMGNEYAAWLGSNPDEVNKIVLGYHEQFEELIEMQPSERYWVSICATIYAGAFFANQLGANFHLPELWKFLIEAYKKMRARVANENAQGGTEINTEGYLTEFFKTHGSSTARTHNMNHSRGHPKPLRYIDIPDFGRFPNSHVNIHWVVEDRLLRISRTAFLDFLADKNAQAHAVFEGLAKHFGMTQKHSVNLGAGFPTNGGGPETVLLIPIKEGTWLDDLLHEKLPVKGQEH